MTPFSANIYASHTFNHLQAADCLVQKHSDNAKSIHITTLLTLIQYYLQYSSDIISEPLQSILHPAYIPDITTSVLHKDMKVATTRLPIFDNTYQNPIYGYRSLGPITAHLTGALYPASEKPEDATSVIGLMNESYKHPILQQFTQIWAPFGIAPGYHFILILFNGMTVSVISYICANVPIDSHDYGVSTIQPFPSDMSNLLELPHLVCEQYKTQTIP